MKRLSKTFFEQNTIRVARTLLGKTIVRKWRGKEMRGIICETEAYRGKNDMASHASRGRTPRTKVMFDEAGRLYVYLIYGMYNCLNIVTEKKNYPAAVLIRGVINTADGKLISGPGRITKFLHVTRSLNEEDMESSKKIRVERGINIPIRQIRSGKRIGVDYAGTWKNKPWRFYLDFGHPTSENGRRMSKSVLISKNGRNHISYCK